MSRRRASIIASLMLALGGCHGGPIVQQGPELNYGTDKARSIVGLTSPQRAGVTRVGNALPMCLLSPGTVTVLDVTAHAGSNVQVGDISARMFDHKKGTWTGPTFNPIPKKLGFVPLPVTVEGTCPERGKPYDDKPIWEIFFSVPGKSGTHLTGLDIHYRSNGQDRVVFYPYRWDFCDQKYQMGCPSNFELPDS